MAALLAIFVTIVVANEALLTSNSLSIFSTTSAFGAVPAPHSSLPIYQDNRQWFHDNFPELSLHSEGSSSAISPNFLVVTGDEGVGKTYELLTWASEIQKQGVPVLYFNGKTTPGHTINELQLQSFIEEANIRNKTPVVIIDSADKFITTSESDILFPKRICTACDSAITLYDKLRFSLIFVLTRFQNEEIILKNPRCVGKAVSKHMKPRIYLDMLVYARDQLNPLIKDTHRKFDEMTTDAFYQVFGFRFTKLETYLGRTNVTVPGFAAESVRILTRVIEKQEIPDFLARLLEKMKLKNDEFIYQNHWVPYSSMRTLGIDDLNFKLSKALEKNLVIFRGGYVKFRNNEVMNAVIRAIALASKRTALVPAGKAHTI